MPQVDSASAELRKYGRVMIGTQQIRLDAILMYASISCELVLPGKFPDLARVVSATARMLSFQKENRQRPSCKALFPSGYRCEARSQDGSE
jgi:hypothetical protein